MKKWFSFFTLSFFSHKAAREGVRRGYSNTFLGFVLALAFLWAGFFGGDMLPFGIHYNNSPDFAATVRAALANPDADKRIYAEIADGALRLKRQGEEYSERLFVNTLESDEDKREYSVNGYDIVIDSRPAGSLAEVEAYCVSNDGKNTVITYEEYLTLSEVARLNFDFKLRYTGDALELTDESVRGYRAYLDSLGDESRAAAETLAGELDEGKITKAQYNRSIYELYFTEYYPEIKGYESSSKVPLLRNYYYHEYLSKGIDKYILIFDDYMAGSFVTDGGIEVTFYGFYSGLENGAVIADGIAEDGMNAAADAFIKSTYEANSFINAYAHGMNVISLAPFIALMLMVATLLAYSVLKLWGTESITTLGAMLKAVGSFVWFSGLVAAVFAVTISFFVNRSLINSLSLVLFFAVLVTRSVIFIIKEKKLYPKQEEQDASQTEE